MEPEVHIYIETDRKGPAKSSGRFLYIIEYECGKGNANPTYTNGGTLEDVNENALYITGLLHAMRRMRKRSFLRIHMSNAYTRNSYLNGWAEKWQCNGWKKADGSRRAFSDEWDELLPLMKNHRVQFEPADEMTKFSRCMRLELRREDYVEKYHAT